MWDNPVTGTPPFRFPDSTMKARTFPLALRILPKGGGLSADRWARRHQGIVLVLWVHVVAIPIYALIRGFSVWHAVFEASVVAVPAVAASMGRVPRRARTLAAAIGLLSSSAVLVHISGGLIEMHFHFFVMVAVVAMYHDWIPFLLSIVYVLVHHGLAGALDPRSVYNHPAAIANPWGWAGVHALFIAGISAALLTYWRLNESYLEERKRAEHRARRETRTVATLNEIGKSLTGELDLTHVVQKVTDAATELTAAEFGAFFYNVDDGQGGSYMLYTLSGVPREAFERFPMPRNTAVFAPTFSGEDIVRIDDVTTDPRYGKNEPYFGMPKGHLPVRSYLAIPVMSGDTVLGGLFLGHGEPGRFTEDDERLGAGIAAHAAAAIRAATLFDSERRARERLTMLSEASNLLVSSLDLETMMAQLGTLLVPRLADVFVAHLLEEDQTLTRLVLLADGDTSTVRELEEAAVSGGAMQAVLRAIRSRHAELIGTPSDGAASESGLGSTMVVPLSVHGQTIGAFLIGTHSGSKRGLGTEDLELAEEIGRRAAAAAHTARVFARQRDTAEILQHALLPDDLPQIPGVSTAARYVPGGPGVEVGGDWYDTITLRDGSIALVMGDVVGRGIVAASLMGQLKSAVRAYSLDGYEPAEVLRRMNGMLHDIGSIEQMATLIYCVFDPSTGVLRAANAGHPPPLILQPEGGAHYFEEATGVPLGALDRARYTEAVAALVPGSAILLYTDGLVESRETPLDVGLKRLMEASARAGQRDLGEICDELLACAPTEGEDDTAILALRWHALGDRLSYDLPARPLILRPLRATLRRWLSSPKADDDRAYELITAVSEAVTNVIRHAAGYSETTFRVEGERGDDVTIRIRDRGIWRAEDQTRPGGRGIDIMRALTDGFELETGPDGTVVTLRKRLGARNPAR